MAGSFEPSLTAEWTEQLLTLPGAEQQAAYLSSARLLHSQGLQQLLDHAMRLARSDPGKARSLASVCANLADQAAAPVIRPRATYLRAQTHAANGEFDLALDLIQSARTGYEAIGESLEALRTNLGRMHVLNELGRHPEALATGQAILTTLAGRDDSQARLIAAIAHQNCGICHETTGQYEAALQEYSLAAALFDPLGLAERSGDVTNNRGIVLLHLGRASEALAAFEAAARIYEAAGLSLLHAQTLSNMGEAHLVLGGYSRGLQAFEAARRLLESLDAQAHYRILLRKTADAYLALNLYPEALGVYQEAVPLLAEAGMADHRARALWGLGATQLAQGQLEAASASLAEAAQLFETAGNIPMQCSVLLEQAAVQDAQSSRDLALQTARYALSLVADQDWPVQRLYAGMRVADLLLPNTAAAEPFLREAQRLADGLGLPVIGFRVNRRLGHLRRLQGREAEAQVHLEAAIAQIESLRGGLAQEAIRASFLQDKVSVYEDLIRLHLERGDAQSVRQAFGVAERAKARSLVDLLTGVLPAGPAEAADPALAARLQTLQADLNAAYNRLLEPGQTQTEAAVLELQSRAANLEREIAQLRLRAAGAAPGSDPFIRPLPLESLQARLPDDLLLIAYHIVGDEILAFVHWQYDIQVVRRLSRTPVVQELLQRLHAQWDRFRAGRAFAQRHMPMLEKTTRRILASLYAELVGPLQPHIDRCLAGRQLKPSALAIVPHGLLHQVPFHALHDGGAYLVDEFDISYAPSATVLALCQQRQRTAPARARIFALADALIPNVEDEARTVGEYLAQAGVSIQTMTGAQASLAALREAAAGSDILHLACHGLFRADNPLFSALKLSDGWLTAADALELRLSGALVTLSACESGRGTVIPGDEVIGLPRAFLGAGAASVVVSLWLAHDETTSRLMARWYHAMDQRRGPAAALCAAQREIKEQYAHPYYWAPFALMGQR